MSENDDPQTQPQTPSSTGSPIRAEPVGVLVKGIYIPDDFHYNLDHFLIDRFHMPQISKVLVPAGLINDRIEKLALDVYMHYENSDEPLQLVCVMQGALRFYSAFTAALRKIRSIRHAVKSSETRPAYSDMYIKASSYVGTKSTGTVSISTKDMGSKLSDVKGKHLLIVEDLVDTGRTLKALTERFEVEEPLSIRTICLFSKRVPDWNGYVPDWVGFDLPAEFLVGFGLDYNEAFRDLEHLCVFRTCD